MTAVTTIPAQTVTGSAKERYQPPPVISAISSKYSDVAAKSQGTNITGFGLRNHSGNASTMYPSSTAPKVYQNQFSPSMLRKSTKNVISSGIANRNKIAPFNAPFFTEASGYRFAGYSLETDVSLGIAPPGSVLQIGHLSSESASLIPQLTQYIAASLHPIAFDSYRYAQFL